MKNEDNKFTLGNKLKVLVVEDDVSSQELVEIILRKNFDLDYAITGNEALELIEKQQFNLILMDISLKGGLNGLELTRLIRTKDLYKSIPIIAVTAHAFENDRIASLEAGCNDYLPKPIRKNDLLEIINNNLA